MVTMIKESLGRDRLDRPKDSLIQLDPDPNDFNGNLACVRQIVVCTRQFEDGTDEGILKEFSICLRMSKNLDAEIERPNNCTIMRSQGKLTI